MRFFRSLVCVVTFSTLLQACSDGSDETITVVVPEPAPVTLEQETIDLPSAAQPANTPGSPGVEVSNPKLLAHFGSSDVDLNNARYTRYFLSDRSELQPDAILVLVPGFEGGASNFYVLADNLLRRAAEENSLTLEVWAIDRRSNQLEDTVGLDLAEESEDILLGLDFLFGGRLDLPLSQPLVDGPNRRAVFYENGADVAFMANWTTLVHSQDIDAVVEQALATVRSGNVFLGGHSAGTGYTARYASTDFNFDGTSADPGYAKLRGLVLLEGGGGSVPESPPDASTLDLIEARFDGGLYGAIMANAPRCADGITPCEVATQEQDCAALAVMSCVTPVSPYSDAGGLLSPQLLAVSEVTALDIILNGQGAQSVLQQEQGGQSGNTAISRVPQLASLNVLLGSTPASSLSLLGQFLDDDGIVAQIAPFVATSVGYPGPEVDGISTWMTIDEELPAEAYPDNGPAPTSLPSGPWGIEVEPSDLIGHMMPMFYKGQTNFSDWYYPSSGLSVTSGLGLDSTALSAPPPEGRGRSDIVNLTQASAIDIPVIAFGGSNGLTPTPASWLRFAESIAPCASAACDGVTPRIVDSQNPNPAFPTFGEASGGFEVYISEGYAHLDVLTAEDDETNEVIGPLLDFVSRHIQ